MRGDRLAFRLEDLLSVVGKDLVRRLIEARIVKPLQNERFSFYHQLLHDYLASRSLSKSPNLWIAKYFDALSFDANSYEALIMILDQLGSESAFSQYITALYDWSWFATIRCVERALRDRLTLPNHLKVALSAMLGEKRFDPVIGSRDRAGEWSVRLDNVTGFEFSRANSVAELVDEVDRVKEESAPSCFLQWYELFSKLRDSNYAPTESELNEICNPDPFIGWTATQVARHSVLDAASMRQIRGIYLGARYGTDAVSCSVRWRSVHALGCHPSSENAHWLLEAIDSDQYSWVIYGAVRSLLEMAALSDDEATQKFLSHLDARLSKLPAEPLSQVARATRYEGASAGWPARVWPLLEHGYELQTTDKERVLWKDRMDAFRSWAALEASS